MAKEVVINDNKAIQADIQRDILTAAGLEVSMGEADEPDEVASLLEGASAVITDAGTPFTEAVFEAPATDDLEVVARSGIGYDNIDVEAAAAADVTVVNVPDYCLDEVSTHAMALLLSCVRQLGEFDRQTRNGGWDWSAGAPIHRTAGRTMGLLGLGNIGRRTAAKAAGFDMEVIACDPYLGDDVFRQHDVERVEFEELFDRAEYLSVHTPLTEETCGIVDRAALDRLSDGAIVINTARGPVIDEAALADALDDGPVRAAGLDVLAEEPPTDSPLVGRDDVIISPHVAWYSEESREELSRSVANDVRRILSGEDPRSPVTPAESWG